eukprot:TRINITY_DN58337_c0_g1_i1.p2 TRINITY_DN58337_c0_g1~~TRINITY_DN58337_c0_g1_i1.p2  ORF type:complete len:146 (+),score=40.43 TRINITY_DN58337_c0_g1_i1:102-539(+)
MADEEDHPTGPTITMTSVAMNPEEECAFEMGLGLAMGFTTDTDLPDFRWEMRYVVDTPKKRLIIEVGSTDPTTYPVGPNEMQIVLPALDMSIVPEAMMRAGNGLFVAALTGPEGQEIMAVNMVVQITVDEATGTLRRFIYNPMEE